MTTKNEQAEPQSAEPVVWRDHVEQRLRTWRQNFVNRSGDQLALDDFMDKRSLDDLIDFVCDEYASPPDAAARIAELERENQQLRTHIDKRAAGVDPLTQQLRERAEKAEREFWLRWAQVAGAAAQAEQIKRLADELEYAAKQYEAFGTDFNCRVLRESRATLHAALDALVKGE